MNNKLVAVLAVFAIVLSGLTYFGVEDGRDGRPGRDSVGASPGPTKTETQYFLSGFETGSVGATISSTTVALSLTLIHSDMRDGITYIEYTPTIGALTITTEATSTFALSQGAGSSRTILVYNATTTTGAPSVITWAAGTGFDLQNTQGDDVLFNGLESARLTFVRKVDSDIMMWVEVIEIGD